MDNYKKIFANKNIIHKLIEEKHLHIKVVTKNKLINSDDIYEKYIKDCEKFIKNNFPGKL